jgi:hypothetical protein
MEESVYRGSLSFEAGFCLHGDQSVYRDYSAFFGADSALMGVVCPFDGMCFLGLVCL